MMKFNKKIQNNHKKQKNQKKKKIFYKQRITNYLNKYQNKGKRMKNFQK